MDWWQLYMGKLGIVELKVSMVLWAMNEPVVLKGRGTYLKDSVELPRRLNAYLGLNKKGTRDRTAGQALSFHATDLDSITRVFLKEEIQITKRYMKNTLHF